MGQLMCCCCDHYRFGLEWRQMHAFIRYSEKFVTHGELYLASGLPPEMFNEFAYLMDLESAKLRPKLFIDSNEFRLFTAMQQLKLRMPNYPIISKSEFVAQLQVVSLEEEIYHTRRMKMDGITRDIQQILLDSTVLISYNASNHSLIIYSNDISQQNSIVRLTDLNTFAEIGLKHGLLIRDVRMTNLRADSQ